MAHALIQPGGFQTYTVVAKYPDGSPLSGTIKLTLDRHDGTGPALIWTATSLSQFVTGVSDPISAAPIGDETLTAVYTPNVLGSGATSSANFQVRALGSSLAVVAGAAHAGSPTTVTTTITVPISGHPIGGRVAIQVDALGELANCTPSSATPTMASCSTKIPGTLAVGTHALTVIWSDSPSFTTVSYAGTLTVVKAQTASSTTVTTVPSATPTAPTPAPTPAESAVAAPSGASTPAADSLPETQSTSNTSAASPFWIQIVLAVLLIAFLGAAALVVVGVVRARRSRAGA